MEYLNQNPYNSIFVNSKHRAKVASIESGRIVVELLDENVKGIVKFSHLQFPDVWLYTLMYRKVDEVLPVKVMHISNEMEFYVVPTDLVSSLSQNLGEEENKTLSLESLEATLEQSIALIKEQINKQNAEADSLTQKSLGIFRGIKELNGCCSKKLVRQLKGERSDILRQRKEVNNRTFELFINLRANEAELESLKNEIKRAKSKTKKLQHT